MAYYSNSIGRTTRLTGLSSGLDTDSLIKTAMAASQSKLDRMYQKKTTLEWKRDAYTDVRSKVSTFANKYLSVLSEDNVFSRSAYQSYKVNISDKYSSYFSVKGTANAQVSSHKISSARLAEKATIQTKGERNRYAGLSSSATANSKKSVVGTRELLVKDGNGYKAATANDNLKDIVYEDGTGNYVKAFKEGTTVSYKVNGYTTSATVGTDGGTNGDTLGTLMSVNSASNAKMSIDSNGKLSLESTIVGDKTALTFEASAYASGTDSKIDDLFGKNGLFGIDSSKVETKCVLTKDTKLSEIEALTGRSVLVDSSDPKDSRKMLSFSIKTSSASTPEPQFMFYEDASIEDVINGVNTAFGDKEVLSFDEASGQFMVRSDVNGGDTYMEVQNIRGNFFSTTGQEGLTGIRAGATSGYQTIERNTDTIASAAAKMGVKLDGNQLSFKISSNGTSKEFTFNNDTTLAKMMSQINSDADLGVHISYSQITDRFEITSSDYGTQSTITFENGSKGDAAAFFGVQKEQVGADGKTEYVDIGKGETVSAHGKDAQIVIDGQTINRSSNTFTLDGLEITLFDNFQADLGTDTPAGAKPSQTGLGAASLSVEQDVEGVVTKMKNFVTAYNELVESLYGTITEEKDYDYEPLTDDQKDALDEKDIEKYEAEAKKGILHGDSTIRTFLSQMRSAIFEKLGGTGFNDITGETNDSGLSAYDLGFNTSKYAAGEYGGKLTFDEDKFRTALKRDPESVANAMAGVAEDTSSGGDGFITKLQGYMADFQSTIRGTQLKNTNESISDMETTINNQLDKMYEEQERLYQMYAQLETIMTNAQSQMQWMTQQFSSLTTTS